MRKLTLRSHKVTSSPWGNHIRSYAVASFWSHYNALPVEVRRLADKQFRLFSADPGHRSLGFARKGAMWTAEVGRSYRAMARKKGDDLYWFWIGSHEAYNNVLSRLK